MRTERSGCGSSCAPCQRFSGRIPAVRGTICAGPGLPPSRRVLGDPAETQDARILLVNREFACVSKHVTRFLTRSSAASRSSDSKSFFHSGISRPSRAWGESVSSRPWMYRCTLTSGKVPPFRARSLVRSTSGVFSAAASVDPFPVASVPWHTAQYWSNMALPSTDDVRWIGAFVLARSRSGECFVTLIPPSAQAAPPRGSPRAVGARGQPTSAG